MSNNFSSARLNTMLICVLTLLIADLAPVALADESAQVEAIVSESPIIIENLPPLMCGKDYCEVSERTILRGDKPASEEYGWWFSYGPDLDFNGMDDRLQRVIAGMDSESPTSIIGEDGKFTIAIVVDYAWHPTLEDESKLREILLKHGWIGEESGAWFQTLDSIDSISVDKVPVSALIEIWSLPEVVVVEMQNVLAPSNDIAVKAARVQPSEVYSNDAYSQGYTGEGIVIAVLDTGVDNEHRSLNDFDDQDDAPDLDPKSYDDNKWLAGYDATSSASNPDGSQDPDDGQGHGTHVAGSALGTGGPDRNHIGGAPGAHLVDIKVLTDAGGTNSQYSLNGIQWMINNANTEWDGNGSAKGIQIGSMSFGSLSSPLNPGDQGDNGSGAEARLINNATENGIVCVVAMGNDGTQRVPSPASADGAISVGSANDRGSVNRTDDGVSSFSNYGPRLSDDDDDDWDELKPDVTAYGSGIMSASAATGATLPGQPTRPMAGNDYDEKDGTSMATPHASGIVALMLQANPDLDPYEVKDILRNSSESRGSASETSVSDRWNDKWGFGLLDASCAIDTALERSCSPLEGGGGGIVTPPPTGNGTDFDATINSPENGTWLIAGDFLRISGTLDDPDSEYDRVEFKVERSTGSGTPDVLRDWTVAGGELDSWYYDLLLQENWIITEDFFLLISARAMGDDAESATTIAWTKLGKMSISISSPSIGTDLVGNIQFSGIVHGIEHGDVEYKIDNGDWILGQNLPELENGNQEWSFSWDSTTVEDGNHRVSVRMVNKSGVSTESTSRTYNIDNQPAAPAFRFVGSVEVVSESLPVSKVIAGSIVEVTFSVTNFGDLDANDVRVSLEAPGEDSEIYPSEKEIQVLNEGDVKEVTLYWSATEPGLHEVSIIIDPYEQQNEIDKSDNIYSFDFLVEERPISPMLRFKSGSVITKPLIPLPNQAFDIQVRVDNLGQESASNIEISLERLDESVTAWVRVGSTTATSISGSSTSSGTFYATFADIAGDVGASNYRVVINGNDVDSEFNTHRFNVIVDNYSVGSASPITLSDTETFVDMCASNGGLVLFVTEEGKLIAKTLTFGKTTSVQNNVLIEEFWGGQFTCEARSDDFIQMAWTRTAPDNSGYTLTDIGTSSMSSRGDLNQPQYLMTKIKLSEGQYWGFDMDERDGVILLAGYHRDIATAGSWQDVTSIFILSSASPDVPGAWDNPTYPITDIDIRSSSAQPLQVELGVEHTHVLYQEMRDDVTGVERPGMMYAHGNYDSPSWGYLISVGDYASHPQLEVISSDGTDVLVAAWVNSEESNKRLEYVLTDDSWSAQNNMYVDAPGMTFVELVDKGNGVQLFHDQISIVGPSVSYGVFYDLHEEVEFGASMLITEGILLGAASPNNDTALLLSSNLGSLSIKGIAEIAPPEGTESSSFLDVLISFLPGDDTNQLVIFSAIIGGMTLFLVAVGFALTRAKRKVEGESIQVFVGEEVEMMINVIDEDAEMAVNLEEEEIEIRMEPGSVVLEDALDEQSLGDALEEKALSETDNQRLQRRVKRKMDRELKEKIESDMAKMKINPPPQPQVLAAEQTLPAPANMPPLPELGELPPLPNLGDLPPPTLPLPSLQKNVTCNACNASFTVKDLMLSRMPCPVCGEVCEF